MKISRNWLSDFVEWIETDPQIIADHLTRKVGEVEEVIEQGANLDNCVVGKILTLDKHPNADRLAVCTIQTERWVKNVVCGGTNLRKDMVVAFAHVGSKVQNSAKGGAPVPIEKVNIRGAESKGMICASEELGLQIDFPPTPEQGQRPVMDLDEKKFRPGTPLRIALGLNDVIFHIDNHAITNRPDLFSHVGVARELVAMGLAKWKKIPARKKTAFPKNDLPFKRVNEIPDLVPRYCACTIDIGTGGTPPDWMKIRLEALGWRAINLPVDITNYVSLELGMPLHCFDVGDLKGTVRIRTAKKGEKIITLDEVERALPEGAIVLSDDLGIFDLLGIMGGLRSSTKAATKTIYLHAAIVDPVSIRKAIIATGHRTDAATVYEKGIPRISAETGFFRALELILELIPEAKITSHIEVMGKIDTKKSIKIPEDMFSKVIGAEIKPGEIKRILMDLGFKLKTSGKNLSVTPPHSRSDIVLKQDVIEEVARIYGYADVPVIMPEASIAPPDRDQRINKMRDSLKESGYFEHLHVAFTSPQLLSKMGVGQKAVSLENPIGEELGILRPGLLPGLLVTSGRELKVSEAPGLKFFEVGHAFSRGEEWNELTLVVASRSETTIKDDPLLILKKDVIQAMETAGHEAEILQSETVHTMGHPGRSAEIKAGGKRIGLLFEVHPNIRAVAELKFRAAACVIDLDH